MAEYQILNLMQVGFIQNSMYFVGMVLFTWLGFRMANNMYNSPDANMLGKVFTSVFCIFVAAFMFGVNQIGGSILESAVMNLSEIGAPSAERMAAYLDFPLVYPNGAKGYEFYFQNHFENFVRSELKK